MDKVNRTVAGSVGGQLGAGVIAVRRRSPAALAAAER
jgi:hypothetical protein